MKFGLKDHALPTELAVLEQKHVTLFAVSNLNCVASFFDSYAFAALRDSFWVALVISDFSCFPASYFSKTGIFRPQGNWPLSVGSKVERSTELAIWTRWKFCPFVFCHFERSPNFFECFAFPLPLIDSFLIAVVYSDFLCFLAFSSVKKGSDHTQETQTLENWNKISTLYRLS